jgi:hypothetical protein
MVNEYEIINREFMRMMQSYEEEASQYVLPLSLLSCLELNVSLGRSEDQRSISIQKNAETKETK